MARIGTTAAQGDLTSSLIRWDGGGVWSRITQRARPNDKKEERQSRRYLTNLPVLLSFRDRDLEGYCNNIAEGGLGAFLPERIPLGSVALVKFVVPTHPTELHVQVVVRYQFYFQHGPAFLSLSEAQRLAIRQFCTQLPSVSSV